jgi:transcriptional regulator with XRE-family HTH domain
MMQTARAAIPLNVIPLPANRGNPWVQAAAEDTSLAIFPFGGSYFAHCVKSPDDRRFIINFGKFDRCLGEIFAQGSSANFEILAHVHTHDDPIPQQIEQVRELRQLSGLTWHYLAELIGVSAKTLHNWAAGKPVDAKNQRRVAKVIAVLRFIDRGNGEANRALLLNETIEGISVLDLVKAGEFDRVRQAIARGQGRTAAAPPLPPSTVAAWGPDDLGERLSKWQGAPAIDFEPNARPTRTRPANARRKR